MVLKEAFDQFCRCAILSLAFSTDLIHRPGRESDSEKLLLTGRVTLFDPLAEETGTIDSVKISTVHLIHLALRHFRKNVILESELCQC